MLRCCCGEMLRCVVVRYTLMSTSHHITIISHHLTTSPSYPILFGRKESTSLPKFFSSLTTDDDTLSMPGRA